LIKIKDESVSPIPLYQIIGESVALPDRSLSLMSLG